MGAPLWECHVARTLRTCTGGERNSHHGGQFSTMTIMSAAVQALFFVGIVVVCLRLLAYLLRHLQLAQLYFPDMPSDSRQVVDLPVEYGFRDAAEISIHTSDKVKLHGFLLRMNGDWRAAPTVLYWHGNAGNVGHRLPMMHRMMRAIPCNVVLVDYRGYGLSEGEPYEGGVRKDAQAALDWCHTQEFDRKRLVVMGSSLGAAVAAACVHANQSKVAGLIVENTFTSISDMVDVVFVQAAVSVTFPQLIKPVVLLIQWDTAKNIGKVRVPILFLSGELDELLPPQQMASLYSSAVSARHRNMVTFPSGTHNDTWTKTGFFEAIADFLRDHAPSTTTTT
eukprot:gene1376-2754_t